MTLISQPFFAAIDSVDEGWAILLAAFMAIVGIAYTARQQRLLLRRQHTYAVLDKLNDWPQLDKNLAAARRHFDSGDSLAVDGDDQRELRQSIDWILDRYEFIAGAILSGDIDEFLIKRVEKGSFVVTCLLLYDYILEARSYEKRNTIYENVEMIAYRWERSTIFSWLAKPIDWFYLRPITIIWGKYWTPNRINCFMSDKSKKAKYDRKVRVGKLPRPDSPIVVNRPFGKILMLKKLFFRS